MYNIQFHVYNDAQGDFSYAYQTEWRNSALILQGNCLIDGNTVMVNAARFPGGRWHIETDKPGMTPARAAVLTAKLQECYPANVTKKHFVKALLSEKCTYENFDAFDAAMDEFKSPGISRYRSMVNGVRNFCEAYRNRRHINDAHMVSFMYKTPHLSMGPRQHKFLHMAGYTKGFTFGVTGHLGCSHIGSDGKIRVSEVDDEYVVVGPVGEEEAELLKKAVTARYTPEVRAKILLDTLFETHVDETNIELVKAAVVKCGGTYPALDDYFNSLRQIVDTRAMIRKEIA